MLHKTAKIRGCNILFGSLFILGLSFGPAAFDIRLSRGLTTSRRCTTSTPPMNRNLPAISRNDNLLTTTVHTCSRNADDSWDNTTTKSMNAEMISATTSQKGFSWVTIVLMLVFAKSLSLPINTSSSVSTLAVAVVPFVATFKGPTKPILGSKQAAILAGSFGLFRILRFYASSISSWYMGLLAWSPVVTKAVTTATIGVLGDTTAQYLETRLQKSKESEPEESTDSGSWFKNYDLRRGMSFFGENIFISGPLLHFAYNFMEDILPTTVGGRSAVLAAMGHALLDNFVLDTIFLAIMFVTTGIAEGYANEIIPQFKQDFVPTLKTGWLTGLCLLPVQFLLFRFFPLSLRVLGVNIIDVFWEAYISYMVHRRRRAAGKLQ